MKELEDYYNGWRSKAWKVCLIIWVGLILVSYLGNTIISALANLIALSLNIGPDADVKFVEYVLTVLIDFAAPTSVTIGIYFALLKYANEEGWKKKFPQYDIDGEWYDVTTYTKGIDSRGWTSLTGDAIPSPVIIKQTCKSIRIIASIGEEFEWHSLLANWDENDSIRIFYRVDYYANLQAKGYPESRMGYERMTVDRRSIAFNKKPSKMVGKFWHCLADDGKPMYMGDVIYSRNPTEK